MERVGQSILLRDVETASQMMRRYYCTVKETMRAMAGYLPTMKNWQAKKMLARHIWFDAMHADMLRSRTLDLRYPRVDVDNQSDSNLIRFLRHLPTAQSDEQFLVHIYYVLKPLLVEAFKDYMKETDPLDDAPSHAYLKRIVMELEEQLQEAAPLLDNLVKYTPELENSNKEFIDLFARCGAVHGPDRDNGFIYPEKRYELPLEGGRDSSWEPAVMQVPPRDPQNSLEQRLWIAIDHANEVWACETAAAVIWEYEDMKWDLYYGAARWTYDEMRHAMMGEQRLKELGFEMGIDVPMVPDHWRAFRDRGILSIVLLLHGLEQKGPLHKSKLRNELFAVNDLNGAQDCDYDWADESNHISFGLSWIKAIRPEWDKERIMEETQQIVTEWVEWIQHRHESGTHGYEKFMERIEAKSQKITDNQPLPLIQATATHLNNKLRK
ncbi:DUF455 family protein [Paenibacillus sp. LMG 31458]|uniref:DUF455 family protein n=1 Tax=Paenibacillus phytorum TaxID=2654977 RepID=A0ABX1Y104_9BACL|nr:DUF455 family protein [Paenibacillus phytorum]NOU73745.1 DUF455 family protein [Paenibacillus phytorum]